MIHFAMHAVRATAVTALLAVNLAPAYADVVDNNGNLSALIAKHASANNVPESLVRRVIMRESRGNARAISKGNFGLMQIRLGTARGLGYTGDVRGLLDADTNMTYAVKYLAGAYRVAGGNENRAVSYYAAGYYYAAKRRGVPGAVVEAAAAPKAESIAAPNRAVLKTYASADDRAPVLEPNHN